MDIETVQDIGSTIVSDTAKLAPDFQLLWQQFEQVINGKGEEDTYRNNLPVCLQQEFENYRKQQKPELDDVLQKRQQIGRLLSKASSLKDFRDQLYRQFPYIDIYYINNYYNSDRQTIPAHLQLPDDFENLTVEIKSDV